MPHYRKQGSLSSACGKEQIWFLQNLMGRYRGCDVTGYSKGTKTVSSIHTFIESGDTLTTLLCGSGVRKGTRSCPLIPPTAAQLNMKDQPSPVALLCSSRRQDLQKDRSTCGTEQNQETVLILSEEPLLYWMGLSCVQVLQSLWLFYAYLNK